MTAEKGKRAAYTLEYKLEAVRLVQGGQACTLTAKVPGMPKELGSAGGEREADGCGCETCERRTNGTGEIESRACTGQDGTRHIKNR